ncbi:MAG: type II toxin-antitoxin system RelE/ParE family toxin [Pseudomonadales bacterium]|nr:type II toxin-antitoxin system RelE/ParE family toxin [Pseudomonadales bacterium]
MSKGILWVATSKDDLIAFPEAAKRYIGFQLHTIQSGLQPLDWKPMPSIGPGVNEIRYKDKDGQFRVVYLTKFQDAIGVLHCFQKKGQKTTKKDIDLARNRYKDLIRERNKQNKKLGG